MEEGCLVTGKSTDLLAEVVRLASERELNPLVARSGHSAFSEDISASTISWNRRSALSARSVVLHAKNTLSSFSDAVVVYSVVKESVAFHESSIVSIENRTDAEIKGYLFLLREILGHFHSQRHGRLVLALHDQPHELRSPLESVSVGSFVAFAESIAEFYQNEPVSVRLCVSGSDDLSGYADFILGALRQDPPKKAKLDWLRFPQKRLFGSK
jgi:hypothetical protein